MAEELVAYLKSDRQWLHPLRVAHAKWMLDQSKSERDKEFWLAVLAANDKGKKQ